MGTAFVDYTRCIAFLVNNRAALLAAAEGASTKVLSLAPEHALAHHCLGCVQVASNRASRGTAECERSLALDRNLAGAHGISQVFRWSPRGSRDSRQRGSPWARLAHIAIQERLEGKVVDWMEHISDERP